jgi:catechol 2,3-dioxygenase-like lactoylglutathione lyase family enzyme
MLSAVILTLLAWAPASTASAQLLAAKDGPVVYGHHHLNATSIDDHKKFWVETLGGTLGTFGNNQEIVLFPNALIFMRAQAATGPTKGTSFNHFGLSVPNLRRVVDRVKANGFRMVTAEEAPAGVPVTDDIGAVTGPVSGIAYALGPDGVKVELLEQKAQAQPVVHHHLHFFSEQPETLRAWYQKVFGAAPRPGMTNGFFSADLPGVGLNFSPSPAVVGTRGRAMDHIGFEIENLEEFCRRLEAQGIKLDVPYRRVDALNLSIAFITDPDGTYIELTEGLDRIS